MPVVALLHLGSMALAVITLGRLRRRVLAAEFEPTIDYDAAVTFHPEHLVVWDDERCPDRSLMFCRRPTSVVRTGVAARRDANSTSR